MIERGVPVRHLFDAMDAAVLQLDELEHYAAPDGERYVHCQRCRKRGRLDNNVVGGHFSLLGDLGNGKRCGLEDA